MLNSKKCVLKEINNLKPNQKVQAINTLLLNVYKKKKSLSDKFALYEKFVGGINVVPKVE